MADLLISTQHMFNINAWSTVKSSEWSDHRHLGPTQAQSTVVQMSSGSLPIHHAAQSQQRTNFHWGWFVRVAIPAKTTHATGGTHGTAGIAPHRSSICAEVLQFVSKRWFFGLDVPLSNMTIKHESIVFASGCYLVSGGSLFHHSLSCGSLPFWTSPQECSVQLP